MRKGTPHLTSNDTPSDGAPVPGRGRDQAKRPLRSFKRSEERSGTVANDDPTISDWTSLIRFSSAAISLLSFSAPVPCDVDEWTFADALYATPSKCLQANISFARARSKDSPEQLLTHGLPTLFPESLGFKEMFQLWHRHHLSRDGFEWQTTDSSGRHTILHVACYGHIVGNGLCRLWIITRETPKKAQNSHVAPNKEHHLRALLEHPGVLFMRSYADGTLSFCTEHTQEALAIEHSALQTVDTLLRSRCHPSDREVVDHLAFQRHLRSVTPVRTSIRLITEKRGLRSYSIDQLPVYTDNETTVYDIVGVERPAEEKHTQSLLLSGLAHDANNHLLTATASVQEAQKALGEGHPALAPLRAALSAISQTSAIHTQVSQIEYGITPKPESVDVGQLFRDVLLECQSVLPAGIRTRTLVEPAAMFVRIDPTHFRQILTNLVLNARDAMKDHGVITLSATRKGQDSSHRCPIHPHDVVCVSVSDNGPGIELPVLETIFKPFVSTKSSRTPRGLGLAMVKVLMERNNGEVSATSAQGIGTTFTLCLPAAWRDHSPEPEKRNPAAHSVRPLTVLVADDEAHVREIFDGALTTRGHAPTVCKDGPSLLETLASTDKHFDAIIVDDGMPGSSGPELVRAIHELRPQIPVLVVSGDPSAALRLRECDPRASFLAKPFTFEQLYTELESLAETQPPDAPLVPLRRRATGMARNARRKSPVTGE